MKFVNIFSSILVLIQSSCIGEHRLHSAKVLKDGQEILFGRVNSRLLFFDYPEWKIEYKNYQPDTDIITGFKNDRQLAVEIFFGTWCEDSQRDVPRFFKINDLTHLFSNDSISLYAVDRKKQLATDLCSVRKIARVATFIFYKAGREIGRIIEYPQDTLEEDMKSIIKTK